MCGIIGYTGYRQAAVVAYEALKRLEYRGYDSVGIAVTGEKGLETRKDVGKVAEVNDKVDFLAMQGNYGIGHTRWATHGGVTKQNAHPHKSNNGKIVIHNGIVENYQDLNKNCYLRDSVSTARRTRRQYQTLSSTRWARERTLRQPLWTPSSSSTDTTPSWQCTKEKTRSLEPCYTDYSNPDSLIPVSCFEGG